MVHVPEQEDPTGDNSTGVNEGEPIASIEGEHIASVEGEPIASVEGEPTGSVEGG